MAYKIAFTRQATESLLKAPAEVRASIWLKLEVIAEDPFAFHPNVTKLQNREAFRLRIGDWRIIYDIQKDQFIGAGLKNRVAWRGVPMSVKVIERNGQPEWAILPYEEYVHLVEQAEMLEDIQGYNRAKNAIESGEEEIIPAEVVHALTEGENPVKIWREYRQISQQDLAKIAEVSPSYLSQIETGKRQGSTKVLAAIASALKLEIDDLIIKPEVQK